jgi:hypothetical protein
MTDYTDDEHRALSDAGQARAELRQCEKAFEAVRMGLFELIERSPIDAKDVREQAYAGLHILARVKLALEETVAAGEVVENSASLRAILAGEASA